MPRPKSDIEPRVIQAARARFLTDGVDGASLRQIARDAGTSIGMIYYYFPTKDDLFLAVIEEHYERLIADMADLLSTVGSFEERIRGLSRRVGEMSDDELDVFRLVVREALVSSSRLDRLLERFKRGHIALLAQAVVDGVGDGTLEATLHPAVLVMSTLAVTIGPQVLRRVAADRLAWTSLPDHHEFREQLLGVLLGGIGSRARPRPDASPEPRVEKA